MEEFLGFLVLIGIVLVPAIINGLRRRHAEKQLADRISKGLTLRCKADQWGANDGIGLPLITVLASGTICVPKEDFDSQFHINIIDTTDPETPLPVLCMMPECADEDGQFEMQRELTIPYQMSSVKDLPVAVIPTFALMAARRGERRLEIIVTMRSAELPFTALARS